MTQQHLLGHKCAAKRDFWKQQETSSHSTVLCYCFRQGENRDIEPEWLDSPQKEEKLKK